MPHHTRFVFAFSHAITVSPGYTLVSNPGNPAIACLLGLSDDPIPGGAEVGWLVSSPLAPGSLSRKARLRFTPRSRTEAHLLLCSGVYNLERWPTHSTSACGTPIY